MTTPGRIPSPCMNCETRAELMTKRRAQRHDDALAMTGIKRNLRHKDKARLQRRARGKR